MRLLFVLVAAAAIFAKQVMTWSEWFVMLFWLNFWIAIAWILVAGLVKIGEWLEDKRY